MILYVLNVPSCKINGHSLFFFCKIQFYLFKMEHIEHTPQNQHESTQFNRYVEPKVIAVSFWFISKF